MHRADQEAGYVRYVEYPVSFVESLCEYLPVSRIESYFGEATSNPFRLSYLNREIYQKSQAIDTTKIYKFDFIYDRKIDVSSIFVINNKKYRCVKIERNVTPSGFDHLVRGEFYPYD